MNHQVPPGQQSQGQGVPPGWRPPRKERGVGFYVALGVGGFLAMIVFFVVVFAVVGAPANGTPTSATPKSSTPPATSAAELSPLEKATGSRKDFVAVYKIKTRERLDIAGAHRLKALITLPRGLSRDVLEANMRHAVLETYSAGGTPLAAVSVLAWAGEDTSGMYSAAMATFAPGGEWASAADSAPLSSFSVKVEFAPSYFATKPVAVTVGSIVTLANDDDGPTTVLVSRSPTSWLDADAVVSVPNGTKAKVISVKEMNGGLGRVMLRYEVELVTTKQRGWVHSYSVKP